MAIKRLSAADRVKFEQVSDLDRQVRYGALKTDAMILHEQNRTAHQTDFQMSEYGSRLEQQRETAAREARKTVSPVDNHTQFDCGVCGESLTESMIHPNQTEATCASCGELQDLPIDDSQGAAPPAMADDSEQLDEGLGDADALSNAPPPPHILGTIKCPSCSHQFNATSQDGQSMAAKCLRCAGPLSYQDLTLSKAAARRLVDQQAAHTARRRNGRERPLFGREDPVL